METLTAEAPADQAALEEQQFDRHTFMALSQTVDGVVPLLTHLVAPQILTAVVSEHTSTVSKLLLLAIFEPEYLATVAAAHLKELIRRGAGEGLDEDQVRERVGKQERMIVGSTELTAQFNRKVHRNCDSGRCQGKHDVTPEELLAFGKELADYISEQTGEQISAETSHLEGVGGQVSLMKAGEGA